MVTWEEAGELLDEIAEEIPEAFYQELNGGVLLRPEERLHPDSAERDLYILGEYHHEFAMGRYIELYYGSFAKVFGYMGRGAFREQLRKTLLHEFTHHMESLAGLRDLEVKDEERMGAYKLKHTAARRGAEQ